MSFGRNPHVSKAEAAEQKARDAQDGAAYELAWREAARQWDRAASREKSDKLRREYTDKAEAARTQADNPSTAAEGGEGEDDADDVVDKADKVEELRAKLMN
jgi:uncharacterized protein YbjT (DUF2867 family)